MKARLVFFIFSCLSTAALAQDKSRSAGYYFDLGEEALQKKDPRKAIDFFRECLRIDPLYLDAYYSQGMAKELLPDQHGALTDYSIYLERRPEHAEVLFARGVIRYKLEMYDLAKEDFTLLLYLPGGETTTIFYRQGAFAPGADKVFTTQGAGKAYIYNYLGLVETKLAHYSEAKEAFNNAIRLGPNDPDPVVNRGLAEEASGDFQAAMRDYQLALLIDPDNSLARHNLGVLTAQFGQPEDAERLLDEAIERNPGLPYPYAQRAYARFNRGDYRGALEDYSKAVQIDSTDIDYLLNQGIVREKLNDLPGALKDFTKATSLKSDFEKAWFNRGNVLSKLKRYTEAIEDYTLALFYDPSYTAAYYNRALARNWMNQKVEACNDLNKAKELGFSIETKIENSICKD